MARTASRAKATGRAAGKKARARTGSAKAVPTKKAAGRVSAAKAQPKAAGRRAVKAAAPAKRKAAPPKAAARKASPRKAVARKATPRKATMPAKAARRSRPAARPAAAPERAPMPQRFTVSHLNEADFKTDGLRAYAKYRDLGMAEATGGLCQAHVIRLTPPCTDEVRKRHRHEADLQLVYVLKGWVKNEFEGHGEQMMSVGSCWLQPSGIEHTVLDYSADCELLEIVVPADFKTIELT